MSNDYRIISPFIPDTRKFTIRNAENIISSNANGYVIKSGIANVVESGIYQHKIKDSAQRDQPLYKSGIGTPVYSDLTIDSFSYTVDGVVYTVPKIQMYQILITTVQSNKSIVKTPITGLRGTVKEYISAGDDQVVIEGCITGNNGAYPFQGVSDLEKLIDAPVAFKVVSRYLQNLGIDTLVIESAERGQDMGGYSYQKFRLNCITDIPVELNIVSDSNTTPQ